MGQLAGSTSAQEVVSLETSAAFFLALFLPSAFLNALLYFLHCSNTVSLIILLLQELDVGIYLH